MAYSMGQTVLTHTGKIKYQGKAQLLELMLWNHEAAGSRQVTLVDSSTSYWYNAFSQAKTNLKLRRRRRGTRGNRGVTSPSSLLRPSPFILPQ